MEELLRIVRFGHNRYWLKQDDGHGPWVQISADDATHQIQLLRSLPYNEAVVLRKQLKRASSEVDDPPWREEMAWWAFARGVNFSQSVNSIEFLDCSTGISKRTMTVKKFNQILRERFPSKGQVTEGAIGLLPL